MDDKSGMSMKNYHDAILLQVKNLWDEHGEFAAIGVLAAINDRVGVNYRMGIVDSINKANKKAKKKKAK